MKNNLKELGACIVLIASLAAIVALVYMAWPGYY